MKLKKIKYDNGYVDDTDAYELSEEHADELAQEYDIEIVNDDLKGWGEYDKLVRVVDTDDAGAEIESYYLAS